MNKEVLRKEIIDLKKRKNALILAHYYQREEIQEIADFVGDSLDLSRKAKESNADIIVFAGVHFMAETAKILNPEKKVLLPDLQAGCSLASSCEAEGLSRWKSFNPDHYVISYINCSAEVKALSDIICTSANASQIINSFPVDAKILFAPDKNLGTYLNRALNRNMKLWDGVCIVHDAFSFEKFLKVKLKHPEALVLAHPESESHLLELADFIGSTRQLIEFVRNSTADSFIIGTEAGILHKMRQATTRDVHLIPVPIEEDNQCACSECAFMKVNTLEKLHDCLRNETPEILLEGSLMNKARIPIERMLKLS